MRVDTRVQWRCAFGLILMLLGSNSAPAAPLAELVSVTTTDGVLLHGLHYRPRDDSRSIVVHIPGGPGPFYSAQDMAPLADALNRNGYHFLSINMRTAGTNGLLYGKFEDYLEDVGAALRYARDAGLSEIILLGHSLGAARVVYYLSRTRDPAVKGLVLTGAITSPYLESQMRWNEAERAAFDRFLEEQRGRVKAGRGRELAVYPWGPGRNFEFSAFTWVNVFGNPEDSNASTVKFAADITVPVLLVHGKKDTTALPANAEQIKAALRNSPATELVWVEGGNHLFVGQAEPYAQAITKWVLAKFPAVRAARPLGQ